MTEISMNNEDKTKELVCDKGCTGTYCEKYREKCDVFNAVMEMAAWKEQQMIEKSIEWLKDIMYFDEYGLTHKKSTMEEFIHDFKQAMEE